MEEHIFILLYFIFSFCIIFPIPVFVLCGITVESMFAKLLKSETDDFIFYHLRRSVATIMVHSSLPLGYALGKAYMDGGLGKESSILWQLYFMSSILLPVTAAIYMFHWARENWSYHPITAKLKRFSEGQDVFQLARDVANEYRGPQKIVIQCDPTSKVVATSNWIIKVSPYTIDLAHQSDVSLQVVSADEHQVAVGSHGGVQYLVIQVTSSRPNVNSFTFRINSIDFKDLQDMISPPISVMDNIRVQSTLTDRFLVVFKEQVLQNPTIDLSLQVVDDCWGCSEKRPNVKLVKTCGSDSCSVCYCRPMWCVDCMGIWFASRQEEERPDRWMASKCTCPLCRNTFCVLDVSFINEIPP